MATAVSHQLPSNIVAPEFGEVNVADTAAGREVHFTILMEPQGVESEGWQTGVALDASASMKSWYGQSLSGKLPAAIEAEYVAKGWITQKQSDGRTVKSFQKQAYADAIQRGVLTMSTNIVEPAARDFIAYLASNLDADGGTTVIYWACGNGAAYEVVGDFTSDQCKSMTLTGPSSQSFGSGTQLLPAVKYFVDRFTDAARGMYVFLTDGRLDDLEEVKAFTKKLCKAIAGGTRNPVKCVLIGVGDQVDEGQMEELDDLDSGTDVDVWDHKIHREMRGLMEIFAEVVSENTIVAPTGTLFGPNGETVTKYSDGVPAVIRATLPKGAAFFELEVAGQRIRQPLA